MTKTVYAYAAEDGAYLGERTLDNTDRSPISGAWQIPAYMTETQPPAAKEGYDLCWRSGKWEQVEQPKPAPTPSEDTEPQEMDVQPIPETELAVMEGMVNIQTRLAAIEAKLKGGE